MVTYVILRSNRVVRGYTTDATTSLAAGETLEAFTVASPGAGYFVYQTDGTFRSATLSEVRNARVDDTLEAQRRAQLRQTLLTRMEELETDGALPARLRALVAAWHLWFEDR